MAIRDQFARSPNRHRRTALLGAVTCYLFRRRPTGPDTRAADTAGERG